MTCTPARPAASSAATAPDTAPGSRSLLPLTPTGTRHGGRSFMTCQYRCGNACDHPEPNRTGHGHVQDEIAKAVARRSVLKGAAAGSGMMVLGGTLAAAAVAPAAAEPGVAARPVSGDLATAAFTPVRPNRRDAVVTPSGFDHDVVIRWGDGVVAGAPAFDARRQTPEAAKQQFGYNCDYVGVLPLRDAKRDRKDRSLLVVNHEYTDEALMFPEGVYTDAEITAIAMANHGMSVVEIRRGSRAGSWRRVKSLKKTRYNRRVHIDTAFVLDGPAAGDERLRTSADPSGTTVLGTLNNCAGGTTPWGTVLSGEENFNQYFDLPEGQQRDERYTEAYARYGITGSGRGWSAVDPRFDLAAEPHEPHRFGWIVELDPYDPDAAPVKHTMLGRFKHEGANVALTRDGRAVAYMGDDERGDYLYKFVSRDSMRTGPSAKARRHNRTLLTAGTLYVARLVGDGTEDGEHDGTGEWIALCDETTSFVPGMSVADVLLFTRLAADQVAPTRMDRPEDVEPNPVNGKVYAALTNNSQRGSTFPPDEANPLTSSMVRSSVGAPLTPASGNRNGYVLEMSPAGSDHGASTFTWDLMLVCGDPEAPETYFAGFDKTKVSPISCPDNVAFDDRGNLWISTDGNALGSNDGVFRVPVAGAQRGNVTQFLTVPRGAEACGPLLTDANRSLWVAVQHPGEVDGATFEDQASTWPHTDDFPRPSVVVAFRDR
ncbi:secreted PhoX family phosphatase [Nocardioides salarius]|uniref:Secreted PhoX family phosphatase n=1 Tax=Nocardioides salarius TaxID=374513 RepID=A0ABS2MFH6_9ACTN|nr:PhoX family phosphatase [Nocardioides salarius]MBM7509941.1 secreted PhoX family phosphatase [Nocardioides salarius]